jgi:hypothetical protein
MHSSPRIDQKISNGKSEAESLAAEENDPIKSIPEREKRISFDEAIAAKEKSKSSEKINLMDDHVTLGGRKDLIIVPEKDRTLEFKASEGALGTDNLLSSYLAPQALCNQPVIFLSHAT